MTGRDTRVSTLTAEGLSLEYEGRRVVHGVELAIPGGKITAIVGANASGKSTLLRGIGRLMRPSGGLVRLDGDDIHRLPTRRVAKTLGLLPQEPRAPEGITVGDLVARGRHPHRAPFARWNTDDEEAVRGALESTDSIELAGRQVDSLSGGQRQRVWIAMALAQEPRILLLDEPTSFLDLAHQIDVLELLRNLNRLRAVTVVMVLHELNMAARYADCMVVMDSGRTIAVGEPHEVLRPDVVRTAFGLDVSVIPDPVAGTPMVVPIGRARSRSLPHP